MLAKNRPQNVGLLVLRFVTLIFGVLFHKLIYVVVFDQVFASIHLPHCLNGLSIRDPVRGILSHWISVADRRFGSFNLVLYRHVFPTLTRATGSHAGRE